MEGATRYFQVISNLQGANPTVCVLGLTATPYQLGYGWIYELNAYRRLRRAATGLFFKKCTYELSTRYMIRNGYLTPPVRIESPVASYVVAEIEKLVKDQKRITPLIVRSIQKLAEERHGVMIFTSTVRYAQEVLKGSP